MLTAGPVHVRASELGPGQVVVVGPGDTRQVFAARPAGTDGSLVAVDWGDGRHSLFDVGRWLWRLHPPAPAPDPKSDPGALDSQAQPDDSAGRQL